MTRPIDRAHQAHKHVGPYYPRDAMRRVIEQEPTETSIIERITEAYNEMSNGEVQFFVVVILACVFCAALIVAL